MNLSDYQIKGYNFTTREFTLMPKIYEGDEYGPSSSHQKRIKIEDLVSDTNEDSESVGNSCRIIHEFMKSSIKNSSNKIKSVSFHPATIDSTEFRVHCDMINENNEEYLIERKISSEDAVKLVLGTYEND